MLLKQYDDYKVMILPDHPTPLDLMTHTNDPVPFMIYKKSAPAAGGTYSEEGAKDLVSSSKTVLRLWNISSIYNIQISGNIKFIKEVLLWD
mgnify:CR=1 FL=1